MKPFGVYEIPQLWGMEDFAAGDFCVMIQRGETYLEMQEVRITGRTYPKRIHIDYRFTEEN
jgi:hypothetical protein